MCLRNLQYMVRCTWFGAKVLAQIVLAPGLSLQIRVAGTPRSNPDGTAWGVWHLALVGFAAQLPHPFDHMEHTARRARMTEA